MWFNHYRQPSYNMRHISLKVKLMPMAPSGEKEEENVCPYDITQLLTALSL